MARETNPWLTAITLTATIALVGCAEEIESEPSTTARSSRLTLAATSSESREDAGFRTHLYTERDADVYSRLGMDDSDGRALIQSIRVEVGDRVEAGQVLAVLEDDEARLAARWARAEAAQARTQFGRVKELMEREVVPVSEYEAAMYAKDRAEAALERAELELARTRVRAPFSGVVSRRYIRPGELIEETRPLFRITAMAPLRARLLVPEVRASAFVPGTTVRVTGLTGASGVGQVVLVGPTVDAASGTREVIVELAEGEGFRPGATVRVIPGSTVEGESTR
jgi:RND family efflux transporter MFP subunit